MVMLGGLVSSTLQSLVLHATASALAKGTLVGVDNGNTNIARAVVDDKLIAVLTSFVLILHNEARNDGSSQK